MQYDLVIVGSGLAGFMVAKNFRKFNTEKTVAIYSAHDACFYSKPTLSNAFSHKKTPEQLVVKTASQMAEALDAAIFSHTPVEQILPEEKAVVVGGQKVGYHDLVLALGAEPMPLPFDVLRVNHLADYKALRSQLEGKQRVIVIGAGLVGCEFANDLTAGGFDVSVVAMEAYPLARFVPAEMGAALQQALQVDWHFNARVASVSDGNVTLESGEILQADVVVAAAGLKPHLMLAKKAGLSTHQGIVVDKNLQTSAPHIYALGDCAEVDGALSAYISPLLCDANHLAACLAGETVIKRKPNHPVIVKTPACPVAFVSPQVIDYFWRVEGDGIDLRALAYQGEQLVGFVLSGACCKERVHLLQRL